MGETTLSDFKLSALSIEQAADILSKAGGQHVTADYIRADIKAGAPINSDGTVNLLHYISWQVKEVSRGRI